MKKRGILPYWAYDTIDEVEVAEVLLQTIQNWKGKISPTIPMYFETSSEGLAKVLKEEVEPNFIYDNLNNEFGKGVLVGLILSNLQRYIDEIDLEEVEIEN